MESMPIVYDVCGVRSARPSRRPRRLSDQLADEVVQRALDRAAADDRAAARTQARLDRLEREGIVAERVPGLSMNARAASTDSP